MTTPTHTARLWIPLAVALVGGWVVMMLEILGARLLAPYFGYSIYQWGALIGVVLSCLSFGYFIGGQVGDRSFARTFLLWALILSAVSILLVPTLAPLCLPWCRTSGPAWGAVLASAALLGPASVLLGTVSPVIIRLTLTKGVAKAAGRVYAISTVGSIGGTFFTAFYAIPMLGTRMSLYLAGLLVLGAVVTLALAGRQPRYAASAGLLLLAGLLPTANLPSRVVYQGESVHNIIRVTDSPSRRSLYLNYNAGAQTVMLPNRLLTGQYYDTFVLGPMVNKAETVLFLGAAGGTSLKQILAVYQDIEVVGVELDPEVLAVAERYFGLTASPRLELVAEDARWFVENTNRQFDLIAIDLFVTGHIPFFTATKEFFDRVEDRLTDRGLMMMHVRSVREGQDLLGPFVRTVRAVFPSVFVIGQRNYILLASKRPLKRERLVQALAKGEARFPMIRSVVARALPTLRVAEAGAESPLFTDDRNDVELRTFRMSY